METKTSEPQVTPDVSRVRIALPLSGSLRATNSHALNPETSFPVESSEVKVTFLGSESSATETTGNETFYVRRISHIRLEVSEQKTVGTLEGMIRRDDKAHLLLFLAPFGQKTGPGHCPEQELIALRPRMINQTWEPPAIGGIPSILNISADCEPIARCAVDFYAASLS